MSVRLRLALTVLLTGLATALGVLFAVGLAFERFEREAAYARADAFLGRVVTMHPDLLELHEGDPEGFVQFLKSLLLLEPDSQLYLLGSDGRVLAHSGRAQLGPGFRVALAPVRQAAAAAGDGERARQAAYVMGDDPEHMEDDAVVAARALIRAAIRPGAGAAGYLYVVCRKPGLPPSRLARFAANLAGPAVAPVLAVILAATLLAAWIIAAVTRPLRVLSEEVAAAAQAGFDGTTAPVDPGPARDDEFGRLRTGFHALLARLRAQWEELRQLDRFRRESVSNLSHDLRSPLTAAVAGLETLQHRLAGDPARAEERRLVEVALRNTHNAARLVRSLGDLALLDEAEFRLRRVRLDAAEVLDDIVRRFADRAAAQGVRLELELSAGDALPAEIDVELFERAIANLLDNALRFTSAGGTITLAARRDGPRLHVEVRDSGSGIAAEDLPHLFDRRYQGGTSRAGRAPAVPGTAPESTPELPPGTAPTTGEGGKGLGLAIVKRIVELHEGRVQVDSTEGRGTAVAIELPAG